MFQYCDVSSGLKSIDTYMIKLKSFISTQTSNNTRNVELDLFKLLLVIGMIAAHVFQLLHNGETGRSMIWMFSTYINAITFPGFLLAFGCATQLAYLKKPKDDLLKKKLVKNMIRLLVAFYISGFAYTLFVSQNLNLLIIFKILCLWQIPGYSEFILSFAMLMPLVWFLYRPMNTICSYNSKLTAGGGNLSCINLYMHTL